MDREQLQRIIDNFEDYRNIDIKDLFSINNAILDIILKCDSEYQNILINMYKYSEEQKRTMKNVEAYERVAISSKNNAKFMAEVYVKNEYLISLVSQILTIEEKKIILDIASNELLGNVIPKPNIASLTTKILNKPDYEKQKLLVDFLCDSQILKNCTAEQLKGFFFQSDAMDDIEKCKQLVDYHKTTSFNSDEETNSILKTVPDEIIEETIDTGSKEDLEKLARMLDSANKQEVTDNTKEIDGDIVYFKVKFKSSKKKRQLSRFLFVIVSLVIP